MFQSVRRISKGLERFGEKGKHSPTIGKWVLGVVQKEVKIL
jgi:hypothetical protein